VAGVKQIVITASLASLAATYDIWKEITITEKCESNKNEILKGGIGLTLTSPLPCTAYNPQTIEDALRPGASGFLVYSVSKGLADRAAHDFKLAHPDLDLTTIHPSYVYGPFGTGQVYNSPATGTNEFIFALIAGEPDRPVPGYDPAIRAPPLHVDVRDVARAHVLALKVPASDTPKRFILSTSTFTWTEAIEFIAQARPELKGRLPVITGKEPPVPPSATLDTSATGAILRLKSFVKWQDTVLDTIDDLLRAEKELAVAAQ
jgi:nucleoside-diphosphate-sugar epimerase